MRASVILMSVGFLSLVVTRNRPGPQTCQRAGIGSRSSTATGASGRDDCWKSARTPSRWRLTPRRVRFRSTSSSASTEGDGIVDGSIKGAVLGAVLGALLVPESRGAVASAMTYGVIGAGLDAPQSLSPYRLPRRSGRGGSQGVVVTVDGVRVKRDTAVPGRNGTASPVSHARC